MSTAAVQPVRFFVNLRGWILHTLVYVGYVLFFLVLWGPMTTWKIVLAVVLWALLGIGLAVGDPAPPTIKRPRRRFRRGERAARARSRWPAARTASAFLGGVLLCAIGVGQSFGLEVNIGNYPLLSGLCLIVSLGVGISLVIISSAK